MASSCIPGAVVGMNQGRDIGYPVFLLFWGQCDQHVQVSTIELLTLPICLWVVRASPRLLDPSHLT